MDKNSILLYLSDYEPVKDFSLEEKGMLFDAIFEYASTGNTNDLPPVVLLAFKFFRMHIDENNKKWNEIKAKRKEAGSKGGEAKAKQSLANLANAKSAKQNKQSLANLAVNVNDNVNVNVSTEVDIKENTIVLKKDKLSLSSPSEEFIKFNQWLDDHCPFVLKVKTQMTEPEYQKLLAKYTKKEISDVLESLFPAVPSHTPHPKKYKYSQYPHSSHSDPQYHLSTATHAHTIPAQSEALS